MLQWMGKTYAPKSIQATLIVFTVCSFLFYFLCMCICVHVPVHVQACVRMYVYVCVHMCFSPTCISAPPACLVAVEAQSGSQMTWYSS